jgi:amidophosphoribosyltransferase
MIHLVLLFLITFFNSVYAGEDIGHECGLGVLILREPSEYYKQKYKNVAWGAHKACTLIEEQRNRGQDGAGMAIMKKDMELGQPYLKRMRTADKNAVDVLLTQIGSELAEIAKSNESIDELKIKYDCLGEIYLGHVRYGTYAADNLRACQPYICKNSAASKTFALAGNFNMTNVKALTEQLIHQGLVPTSGSDTYIILEHINYYLHREYSRCAELHASLAPEKRAAAIAQEIDIVRVLQEASAFWDGGYVFGGILGNGDTFVCRDPAGIRPGFFYINNEVIAAASERVALMNTFDVAADDVMEIKPGHVLVVKADGTFFEKQFTPLLPVRKCSFERIYFSRDSDPAIYKERKALGKELAARVVQELGQDIDNAVFTYVPNSSEPAFIGLVEEVNKLVYAQKKDSFTSVKVEKLIHKNQRMRTFIANDSSRNNLVARLYTMTKGIITDQMTLVVVDDSIVRGTTLKESIIRQLAQLNPKKIIFVSSAPPVLYPDCYGVDISQIGRFVAFQAAIALIKKQGKEYILQEIKDACHASDCKSVNVVKKIYDQFSFDELMAEIAQQIRPQGLAWQGDFVVIYQTVEGLHRAIPAHTGDWYFTGDYPTPGGYNVLHKSFLQWFQGSNKRAY